jgi:hypothetical protein
VLLRQQVLLHLWTVFLQHEFLASGSTLCFLYPHPSPHSEGICRISLV